MAAARPKLYIVTKTIHTLDKDGKSVQFLASPEPQVLGEHAASAVKAGCAVEHKAVQDGNE